MGVVGFAAAGEIFVSAVLAVHVHVSGGKAILPQRAINGESEFGGLGVDWLAKQR